MGFDEPATSEPRPQGDRMDWKTREFEGHVLIIKPIAHLTGIKTDYAGADGADPVKVWAVDLSAEADDGTLGKVYRNVLIFQKNLIGDFKKSVKTGGELLGHVYYAKLPPPSPYSGYLFASLTGSPETVEAAQMWLQANPWFLKEAEEERLAEAGQVRPRFEAPGDGTSPAQGMSAPATPTPPPPPRVPQVTAPKAPVAPVGPTDTPDTAGVLDRLRRQAEQQTAQRQAGGQQAPQKANPYDETPAF